MENNIKDIIKKQMLKHEEILSKYATKSTDSIKFREESPCIRTTFERDIDKIVHSKSYTRYMGKTQVYSLDIDNVSRRSTHVQFVSRTARTISRALGLNEDLCEAIALGHDIGHVPFGHTGEKILNKISLIKTGQIFAHNVQSVRTLMNLENKGNGINLSLQVLDGIMCHNGEFISNIYKPVNKTMTSFLEEYNSLYQDENNISKLKPMTLEGCIVRLSDIIAYVGKDIEDAESIKTFSKDKISKEIVDSVGNTNKDIMNNIILDVIYSSYDKPYIAMSDKMYNILKKLKKFNYDNIYINANTDETVKLYTDMFTKLFDVYLKAIVDNNIENDILKLFLNDMNEKYIESTTNERKVIDYIAGMTDRYMYSQYDKYVNLNLS
ncbi:MAG: HD domain-containing protein [Clostridia bacterium]|nr:HD domain-containing protein [Clostridia bacterium]MDD4386568.1 HD domain-containing protein [Clostridia bacterium]